MLDQPSPDRKPLHFVGGSIADLRGMPEDVQDVFGSALLDAQYGDHPEQRSATTRRHMAARSRSTRRGTDEGNELTVHEGSGNVFADMHMADAEQRLAKAELARIVRREIRERELTQSEAAELLGIRQPDVSDLVCGKLARFSMTRLERFLNALDLEIRIQVGPRPGDKARAGISVEMVESFS